MTGGAAGFEKLTRRIDVDSHAEIEVRFGHSAHHGGKMEHRAGRRIDDAVEQPAIRDVAGDGCYARISERRRSSHIDQNKSLDRARPAVAIVQRAAFEQLSREPGSEKSGAAGHHHVHCGILLRSCYAWQVATRPAVSTGSQLRSD
jgi:hypothetical protein